MSPKRFLVPISVVAAALCAAACDDASSGRNAAYDAGATQSAAAYEAGAVQAAAAYDAGGAAKSASAWDAGAAPVDPTFATADHAWDAGSIARARDAAAAPRTASARMAVARR
ncbi:MAG: hypothetical protein ACRENE_14015 [Polyangiaceae bacterium]